MADEDEKQRALELLESPRGSYVLAKAIKVAIDTMTRWPELNRPNNDIEDLELLQRHVFRFDFPLPDLHRGRPRLRLVQPPDEAADD